MNGKRNLILAVILAALATTHVATADELDPRLQAIEAWESIEWFTTSCEAGTLPQIPRPNLSKKVDGKGELRRWTGVRYSLKLFPGKDFTRSHPLDYIYLSEDKLLGFGIYCVHVEVIKEPVEVKLVCYDAARLTDRCDDTRQLEVNLSVGYNVVRVDADAMDSGTYHAWFRCPDGARVCWPARVSGVTFVPPSEGHICRYLTEGRWC